MAAATGSTDNDMLAFKILRAAEYAALEAGSFAGSPADIADGFIHLSTAAQLSETAAKHFTGETGLMVLAIELNLLDGKIKWEQSRNNEPFPHLYGKLTMNAVLAAEPLTWDGDEVRLPL
jgi:uncharacterized protein (DUF952 family)